LPSYFIWQKSCLVKTAHDCILPGTGHFVKMIHHGIEYGLMLTYAEGFDICRNENSLEVTEAYRFDLNIADIAEV